MSSPDSTARSMSRREPLSRERIVAAALAVMDAEGLAGLTMRRVARELDAGAMSLYRHVASREELLDLVLDELAGVVPASRLTGEWRVDVAALARDVRAALLARRDLTLLLTARLGQGAGGLGGLDRALGIFLRAGFSPRDAVRSNHALGAYVSGSCTWEAVGLGGAVDPDERARRAEAATARLAGVPAADYPHVAAAAAELFAGTAEDRFEFGLARLLEGFAVRLAETASTAPRLDPGIEGA
jgi:TetR/AcrR family transcriptional regulator, tetracycline repressor protein